MAHLFKPTIVRYRLPDGKVVPKGTPGARKVRERTDKWYGNYRDADDAWKRVPLCADKEAAKTMLRELHRKAQREAAGDVDHFAEHRKRQLAAHLDDYTQFLSDKGNVEEHVSRTTAQIKAILDGCGFKRMADLNPSRLVEFLADLRKAGRSISTSDGYLTAAKGFTRWLVRDRRAAENPLIHLSAMNAKTDVRRERRAMSAEEFALLIDGTHGAKPFRGLSGADRILLYMVAANTGLRSSELASLTSGSFDLTADPPTVTVEAAYSKHRRRDTLPLRSDLVDLLCPLLSRIPGKAPSKPRNRRGAVLDSTADAGGSNATRANVWPGTWAERSARMLRRDLAKARAAWIDKAATAAELISRFKSDTLKYKDDDGRVADFHALRHGFISNLARAGVHPKEAQALARHSTITLTMDRYTHVGITDLTAALERLPGLPTAGDSEPHVLRATGTDSARPTMMQPGCNPVALHVAQKVAESSGAQGSRVSRNVPASDAGDVRRDSENSERNAVFVQRKPRVANGT